MNELSITSIIYSESYQHAIVEDDRLTLSNVGIVHGTDEYNRLIGMANGNEKFYEFLPFYNYVGIVTYNDNIGFELNLFRFNLLDEVLDLYHTFNSHAWTQQDKEKFTKIADEILKSNISPATLSIVEIEDY